MFYFWLVIGSIVGSFLNVCIYRLPRGESVVFPASHCPACENKLKPFDLIPILSYLWLRGRCRFCGEKISVRYPLVEFLTAILFGLAWLQAGGQWLTAICLMIFVSTLVIIYFVDLEKELIPDAASYAGIAAGFVFGFLRGEIFLALVGALLGFFLLWAIGQLGKLWFKKETMGSGDPFVGALLGAYLGWSGALLSIFLAYILAALVVIVLLALRRVKMDGYVPFGPALAAGGVITLFYGERILAWYLVFFLS